MDGKGRAIDNIFIERLWRSVKYEHVYLFPADDGLQCYEGLKEYFEYYNNQRRHQSLDDEIPAQVYQQYLKPAAWEKTAKKEVINKKRELLVSPKPPLFNSIITFIFINLLS